MPTDELVKKLHDLAGFDPSAPQQTGVVPDVVASSKSGSQPDSPHVDSSQADSLIGLFQSFRPDGEGLAGAFDQVSSGEQLRERLQTLFDVAGDDRRPQGGRDAYFVVRNPQPIAPDVAHQKAIQWIEGLTELALMLGDVETVGALQPIPKIRVLEGIPPKHPRREEEKSELLKAFQNDVTMLTARIDAADPHAAVLRQAYYFIACDAMLRDYLMWPLYAQAAAVDDPFEPYFQLWRCGVKYRIFGESQIDLYLPWSKD
tara:strand:+ start:453670 stop:454446 length:777 start_codon:yes stop_codon:yes gene_type:complete